MAGKLGKFQHQTFTGWYSKVTKSNHMGSIFHLQPQMATNMMVQLLALYRGKSLNTFLSKFPLKTFDSDDEYTWNVIGSSMRNIPLVEARNSDGQPVTNIGDANLGKNGEIFYLVFGEDWSRRAA